MVVGCNRRRQTSQHGKIRFSPSGNAYSVWEIAAYAVVIANGACKLAALHDVGPDSTLCAETVPHFPWNQRPHTQDGHNKQRQLHLVNQHATVLHFIESFNVVAGRLSVFLFNADKHESQSNAVLNGCIEQRLLRAWLLSSLL